jgi:hypothetical protein
MESPTEAGLNFLAELHIIFSAWIPSPRFAPALSASRSSSLLHSRQSTLEPYPSSPIVKKQIEYNCKQQKFLHFQVSKIKN